jgi:holo-[acyl-carrier protein] synthase
MRKGHCTVTGAAVGIVGLGTQVVECVRVRKLIDRHGEAFLTRVFTPREIAFCRDRSHSTGHYAAVWAAKEAVLRSLGTTWRKGLDWTDIEIAADGPTATLSGPTRELADGHGVTAVLVTTAHTRAFATATAIACRG